MNTYWIMVRTESMGGSMVVHVQAKTNYEAIQTARAMWGNKLISESANLCP